MQVGVVFVGMGVRDFGAATAWYERFFGRPPDVVAHDTEVLWRLTDGGWLYVLGDDRAGGGRAALTVTDLAAAVDELRERGIEAGPIEAQGDAGLKAVVTDPEGNTLSLLEVAGG
jgi:catechol 2,3-dioxygenase-like lactoylglutathione lyase family enzyme